MNEAVKKLNRLMAVDEYGKTAHEKYRKARESFWEFCKLINPKFFKDSRPHLKRIADTLQALYEGRIVRRGDTWEIHPTPQENPCKKLMLNVPPRHGKSYTVSLFVQWVYGKNIENKVIAVTYNEILAGRFSVNVRDGIDATRIDDNLVVFSDVFPEVKIKDGDAAKQIWALCGQYFSYLGTGFGGTITGVGCNIGIIDDPVKNNKEAFNENLLQGQFDWYSDTFLSRIEEGGIQIIIMTRWSTKDLCGRLLEQEPEEWYELRMQAETDGKMLCPELLSLESYKKKCAVMSEPIAAANYQQKPVDLEGCLYRDFKTYDTVPYEENKAKHIVAYCDTADTGSDYLCLIIAAVIQGYYYVLDVYYTTAPMEITETEAARRLYEYKVNTATIESNNGGRGFARAVEKQLWDRYRTRRTAVKWFHQSQNKQARILSNSTAVMNTVIFPKNWNVRWSDYYKAMSTYQATGKNEHDDAPDATTGLAELGIINGRVRLFAKSLLGL